MKKLSSEPEIIGMANALRLPAGDAVQNIIDFCFAKVGKWIKVGASIRSIWDLEKLVCEKLNLEICDIWSDEDLAKLIKTHVEEGDFIFAHLKEDLDEKTFATLIRRKSFNPKAEAQYIAVIDCRGSKAARRFFTRWHEIAHLLTLYKQMELPLHRSTWEKDPTEKLMDMIAGEIGFYPPLFLPVLAEEIQKAKRISFATVESVRSRFCPEASFQSTLNACVANCGSPAIVLEIGMGYKKEELRQLHSRQIQLLPPPAPKAQLRVLNSASNEQARTISFRVPQNMRVPKNSILTNVFDAKDGFLAEGLENLSSWRSSDGSVLPYKQVRIQAQRIHNRVFAIVLAE